MDLSEKKMLERLVHFLHQFDFIIHWTNYDKEAMEKRCRAVEVPIDMREWLWLDMQRIVTSRHPDFQGNRRLALDEFGKRALGMGKVELTKGFYDTWVEDPHLLSRYCHEDVNLMWMANEKFKFMELEIALGEMLGLPIDELTRPTVVVTKRALEKSFQRVQRPIWRCRPPSSKNKETKKEVSFTGATCIEPIPGFYHNVAIMDFASLYNNVMQMWQMSPEQWDPKTKKFDRFPDTKGIFVEMLEEYTAKRAEFTRWRDSWAEIKEEEWERWELYRKAIKVPILINWGVIGKKESRFFIKEVAQMIVDHAKDILAHAVDLIRGSKTKVEAIYGDTDSVMVTYPEYFEPQHVLVSAQNLVEEITHTIQLFLDMNGMLQERTRLLTFGLEAIFKTFLLGDVKKKYSGAMIWQSGKGFIKPKLHIRGHHSRRGETCDFIRELQTTLLQMIHAEFGIDSIINHLQTLKKELYQGLHNEALIMQVGLRRKLDTYTKSNAPYVRVARELQRLGRWRDGSKVRYYYVDSNEVHPYDEAIERLPIQAGGYQHIWENRVLSWLPALLAPFISEPILRRELQAQQGLEAFM
jgi:DNA polymerase elongation subunit (family B)